MQQYIYRFLKVSLLKLSILNKLFDILEYVQVQLHCRCLPKGFHIFSLQPETKQENNEIELLKY